MSMLSSKWDEYFDEMDPVRRWEILCSFSDEEDECADFCRRLYEDRYRDPKRPGQKVDKWLFKLVYLPGLYRKKRLLNRALKHEVEGTLKDLHLDNASELSELERDILFREFANTAARYLSTCSSDQYASTLFGLKKASNDLKRTQACEDIWQASRGIAHIAGQEEAFSLWCDALFKALLEYDPNSREYYEELEAGIRV